MLKGFKTFLLRGNVIDLAVAVVIGGAFGAVVAALVKDLLTPLIAAIVQVPDFSAITFLLIAIAVYFFVIVPVNALVARANRGAAPPDPAIKQCSECLSEVPIA